MNFILIAVIALGAIGLIAAIVLFVASKKFWVYEDPRTAGDVENILSRAYHCIVQYEIYDLGIFCCIGVPVRRQP